MLSLTAACLLSAHKSGKQSDAQETRHKKKDASYALLAGQSKLLRKGRRKERGKRRVKSKGGWSRQ